MMWNLGLTSCTFNLQTPRVFSALIMAVLLFKTRLKRLRPKRPMCSAMRPWWTVLKDQGAAPHWIAHLARAQPHCLALRHMICPEWVILREIYSAPLMWTKNHTRRCYLEQRDAAGLLNMTRNSDSETIQTIYGTINRWMSHETLKCHRDPKSELCKDPLEFPPANPAPRTEHGIVPQWKVLRHFIM